MSLIKAHFPCKSNQVVSRRYKEEATSNPAVGSIETKGITRSGRYYTPEESNRPNRPKNKGKGNEEGGLV